MKESFESIFGKFLIGSDTEMFLAQFKMCYVCGGELRTFVGYDLDEVVYGGQCKKCKRVYMMERGI